HHVFDAGPIVPAAIEDHDFARRGEVRDETLEVELRLLAIGWHRQRHDAEHAWADAMGHGPDHAALAGGVAPFEHHDHAQALFLDPVLQGAKLDLQRAQRLLVFLALHPSIICRLHRSPPRSHFKSTDTKDVALRLE